MLLVFAKRRKGKRIRVEWKSVDAKAGDKESIHQEGSYPRKSSSSSLWSLSSYPCCRDKSSDLSSAQEESRSGER
jgi:hypothetical protein